TRYMLVDSEQSGIVLSATIGGVVQSSNVADPSFWDSRGYTCTANQVTFYPSDTPHGSDLHSATVVFTRS
ncbi:MAG: hypothetical protein ACYDB7_15645, partial [Mycobacteriales bacterium]